MIWNSFEQFLQMGGYGVYVWGSLAVTVGLLGAEVIALKTRRVQALRRVTRLARHGAHAGPR